MTTLFSAFRRVLYARVIRQQIAQPLVGEDALNTIDNALNLKKRGNAFHKLNCFG